MTPTGIVVWYDPEKHYASAVVEIAPAGATLFRYEGSFFALRREVDALLEAPAAPRLLIYVPLDIAEAHNALVELEALGVVMRPGQQPATKNTRLAVVARGALRSDLGDEALASIESQIEGGKLSLEELDSLGDGTSGQGVLSVVFGSGAPREVALKFLGQPGLDAQIEAKGALPELVGLLRETFDVDLPETGSIQGIRERFARQVLTTDLTTVAQGELPSTVGTARAARDEASREACVTVAREWRLRRDLRTAYEASAASAARDLHLVATELRFAEESVARVLSGESLALPETYLEVEEAIQLAALQRLEGLAVEETGDGRALERLVGLAAERKRGFWSDARPDVQARWALISAMAQVAIEAGRVRAELKALVPEAESAAAPAIAKAYTREEAPWCLLDTRYREMEKLYHGLDFPQDDDAIRVDVAVTRARESYMKAASAVAEVFVRSYRKAGFTLGGVLRQTEIYERIVKGAQSEGKTAYVWVDALRFEMARELARGLAAEFECALEPAVAIPPTVTEIGMAALLPLHEGEATVELVGRERLGVRIGDVVVKDRKSRLAFLRARAGCEVFEAKLEDFLPTPKRKVAAGVAAADLVVITSQEIDQLAEEDNVPLARRIIDETLPQLRRLFRSLAQAGVRTIVVAADHGFIFGEELSSDMKVDPPGGETATLRRRAWVGKGGAASEAYLRARLSDFGLGSDLELATPWGFGCFKAPGGAAAYFHGGLSPQEVLVPVLTLVPKRSVSKAKLTQVHWTLTPGSARVSTRLLSVEVRGEASSMLAVEAPRVRLELRAGKDVLTKAVSASYGLEGATGEVALRFARPGSGTIDPCTVALHVEKETALTAGSLCLVDALTGGELKSIEIDIAIRI